MLTAIFDAIVSPPPRSQWETLANQHIDSATLSALLRWLHDTGDKLFKKIESRRLVTADQCAIIELFGDHVAKKAKLFLSSIDLLDQLPSDYVPNALTDTREEDQIRTHETVLRYVCVWPHTNESLLSLSIHPPQSNQASDLVWLLCDRLTRTENRAESDTLSAMLSRILSICEYHGVVLPSWEHRLIQHMTQLQRAWSFEQWLVNALVIDASVCCEFLLKHFEDKWDDTSAYTLSPRIWSHIIERIFNYISSSPAALARCDDMLSKVPHVFAHMVQTQPSSDYNTDRDMNQWITDPYPLKLKSRVCRLMLEQHMRHSCLDILRSDAFVGSLSTEDAELLALWTNACSLLQEKAHAPSQSEIVAENVFQPLDTPQQKWLRQRLAYLFARVPPSQKEVVAYRGINIACGRMSLHSKNPMAVSYSCEVAQRFSKSVDASCDLCIVLPPGTRFLCVDTVSVFNGDEREILLPPNSVLTAIEPRHNLGVKDSQFYMATWQANVAPHQVPEPTPVVYAIRSISTKELLFLIDKEFSVPSVIGLLNLKWINHIALFRLVRTWQIVQCGFGPFEDAAREFWSAMHKACPAYGKADCIKYEESVRNTWTDNDLHSMHTMNSLLTYAQKAASMLAEQDALEASAAASSTLMEVAPAHSSKRKRK
jgi:hypothetical protein